MTDQEGLEELLSLVVLWDVKQENNFCVIACLYGDIEEETNYLIQHGYKATHDEMVITVSRN